ncbi:MAG: Nif3-like dinuclear metal center hexameric protein [Bacteroidetes bacterium]|jgi:dinuclear metal center YbgI/SA1388 family protein|nr:Nif3-like dinuclear metal center hexameric protein [Bacteroidota bacterium]MBT6687099.1 Nif3-like dinuclear metal center hexameric protein [Bacteroidota bacterium]MBT7144486.1 Nif3-like dinuclear metal center hexameric protein [Bacteroidota bacterium]MBT7490801.1 Nif3-like dinuclear metal center hexameric protein [Bacteroidota bacterium]
MKINELTTFLEAQFPLDFQEDYDNSGLIIGDKNQTISSVLLCFDITEDIVDEAIEKQCNLIISHHPIIFSGLKKITGKNYVERIVIKAIQNNIAIYSAHTNLDSAQGGINTKICEKIGLSNCKVLSPKTDFLKKIVTFAPIQDAEKVRQALFGAGGGKIGDYDFCSYNIEGIGSFRASESANPYVGEKGKIHFEKEVRVETIFPKYLQSQIIEALLNAHPYEEVAYDIYPLDNLYEKAGMGMIGELKDSIDEISFLKKLKSDFNVNTVRHSELLGKKIRKVAVCGGSGSFLLKNAIAASADIFVSGDFKYHEFFDAEKKILIADIGHFESEQIAINIFYDLLTKKFSNFAVFLSGKNLNPINYY